jgi:AraC-like DNA-binding protein/mannose-6-phosphate isomerase-like protein (cupin superfamily)
LDSRTDTAAAPPEAPSALPRPAVPRQRFTDLNALSSSVHIGSFSGQLLHWSLIRPEPWRNYLHSHSFFEVCYAFSGRGVFRILGAAHEIRSGEVFVAWPGEPHEIISADDDPLGIYFWSYTLVPHQRQQADRAGADALLHAFLTSRSRVHGPASAMQRTLELLTEEIVQREPGYVAVIDGLIVKLILDTARAVVDVAALPDQHDLPARDATEVLTQTIRRYLRDNYSRPISLRDVAAQVHLSTRHCNRLFRAATGESIMHCLIAQRMEIAAQHLLERRLSIKEVAVLSGYPDVRNFMTQFRQRTGMTPGRFRQRGGTVFLPLPDSHG